MFEIEDAANSPAVYFFDNIACSEPCARNGAAGLHANDKYATKDWIDAEPAGWMRIHFIDNSPR
jgi:hypothetical protein